MMIEYIKVIEENNIAFMKNLMKKENYGQLLLICCNSYQAICQQCQSMMLPYFQADLILLMDTNTE
jgi:hypothetical protein